MSDDDPCTEALRELYTFLDGELTEYRRTLIATHLDGCTTCLGAYDFEVELRRVIVSRVQERVPGPHRPAHRRSAAVRMTRSANRRPRLAGRPAPAPILAP
jgi:mycothiol system anti-sigma-R factor